MKKKSLLYFLLIIAIGFLIIKSLEFKKYEQTEYEKELFIYFNEIALNSEYDESLNKVSRWEKPMKLFVFKYQENKSIDSIIKKTISQINSLTNDEFKIQLKKNPEESNAIIFFTERNKAEKLLPDFFEGIDGEIYGLTEVGFDSLTLEITDSKIFIDSRLPPDIMYSTILEEITQSIGLMNDSDKYVNSVFYQNKVDSINTLEYSQIDKDVIKLLYHPKMKSGLNKKEAEEVANRIFQNN